MLIANGPDSTVKLSMDSSVAIVNDVNGTRRVRLEAPARRLNGTEYVPMRFLALATGTEANYDAGSRTIVLSGDTLPQDNSAR